jgi:exodeoxyribonuclease VII small subunit
MTLMVAKVGEQTKVESLSYEQALEELDRLIASLESGDIALAEAVAIFERGTVLANRCSELLEKTEAQITELMVKGNGQVAEKPLLEKSARENGAPPIDPDEIPF